MGNMAKFYKLRVADVTRETADCVSIAFEIPENAKDDYKYIQGQYLTLKLDINGEDVRRSYSICTSPVADSELRVAVKKVKDGKGSTYINNSVKVGDYIEVMTPMGNFYTELNPSQRKQYVLFAGGSGITPMLSIIKTVLRVEPGSSLVLFYGNQDEDSTIFGKQLDELEQSNKDRLKVYYIFNQPRTQVSDLHRGLMTKEKVRSLMESYVGQGQNNEFFICGPTPMMDNVKTALADLNVGKDTVHIEYFTPPIEESRLKEINSSDKPQYVRSEVTVICDGDERTFMLEPDQNILDAALAANIDAPYACKGGSCCTCRALLEEGKVEMAVNFALLESEVEEGYILTCQSHALTPKLVVNYDKAR
jgi:ring-1,2-phenylacetyl-CoA epoxidase subunit PaaE